MYFLSEIPGKGRGKGIVAAIYIPRGSRILEESLIITIPDGPRINYACDNNAQKSEKQCIKRYTVHTFRDIAEGE
jgi:hypothetical protein